jgi:hypothetical protein
MSAGTGPLIRHGYRSPSKPIPSESPEVQKARWEYNRAKEDSRLIPAMIQEVRKRIDNPSFIENPSKYIEEWDRRFQMQEDTYLEGTETRTCQFIARHLVAGVLNRTALEEELKELSSRVDACKDIIQKYRDNQK